MSSSRKPKAIAVDLMWMDPYTMECVLIEELEYIDSDPDPSSDESPDRPTHYVETAFAEPEDDPLVVDIVLPSPHSSPDTAENWLFQNLEWPDSDCSSKHGGPAKAHSPSSAASTAAAATAATSAGTLAPPPPPASGRKDAALSAAVQGGSNQSIAVAVASSNAQEPSENQTGRERSAQMRHRFTQWVGAAWPSSRRE